MRRVDGGPGLTGVLRSGGGVLGRRGGEQVKEQAEWNDGVLVMLVRTRGESARALQQARHRDGEVAAAGLGGGAWQSGESTSARQRAVEKVGSDAWVPARSRRWPGWSSTAGGSTAQRRRQEKQASKLEEGEKGPKCNFQKFQGPKCKLVITFKIRLK